MKDYCDGLMTAGYIRMMQCGEFVDGGINAVVDARISFWKSITTAATIFQRFQPTKSNVIPD